MGQFLPHIAHLRGGGVKLYILFTITGATGLCNLILFSNSQFIMRTLTDGSIWAVIIIPFLYHFIYNHLQHRHPTYTHTLEWWNAVFRTGLGFVCFVVIHPRVLSANRVDLGGGLLNKFFHFIPPSSLQSPSPQLSSHQSLSSSSASLTASSFLFRKLSNLPLLITPLQCGFSADISGPSCDAVKTCLLDNDCIWDDALCFSFFFFLFFFLFFWEGKGL